MLGFFVEGNGIPAVPGIVLEFPGVHPVFLNTSQRLTQIHPHLNVPNAELRTGIHMCIYRSDMIQLLKNNAGPRIRVALHHEGRQLVDFNRDQTYMPTQDITRPASPMTPRIKVA